MLVEGKPVCDDNWGLRNAGVVCGQLGYPGVEVTQETPHHQDHDQHYRRQQLSPNLAWSKEISLWRMSTVLEMRRR